MSSASASASAWLPAVEIPVHLLPAEFASMQAPCLPGGQKMADLFTKIEKIFHFGYQCPEIKSHFGLVLTNAANQVALTSVYAHVGAISPGEFRADVRKLELIKDRDTMEPAYILSFTRDEGCLRQGWRPQGSIPTNPPRREGEARDRSLSGSRSTMRGRFARRRMLLAQAMGLHTTDGAAPVRGPPRGTRAPIGPGQPTSSCSKTSSEGPALALWSPTRRRLRLSSSGGSI